MVRFTQEEIFPDPEQLIWYRIHVAIYTKMVSTSNKIKKRYRFDRMTGEFE